MKKFNDIFSIDSSTGGGKRLIKNIINKYRLGNEYKEIKENIENKGSSNNSNFEYWYLKTTLFETPNRQEIYTPTYFRRGVGEIIEYSSPVLKKCIGWPIANTGCSMYAIEVLKLKYDSEIFGFIFNMDATSYDNWIHSICKLLVNISPEQPQFEEAVNLMKEIYVEISKEEFEEIYNNAKDIAGL